MCFAVAFAAFSIDMSPHPGDPVETVFTVLDNVVISQAVSVPTDVLHFDYFNINNANEICVSVEANDKALNPNYLLDSLSAVDAVTVSYIGYEMENYLESDNKMLIVTNIDESRGGYLHFASHYQQVFIFS